jgi:membrane protein
MRQIKIYWRLLKTTFNEFNADNAMKLSASLAYYTIFSVGPLLLLVVSLTGLFFEQTTVTTELYNQMKSLLGKQGADLLLSVIQNMQQQKTAATFSIIGFVVLMFGASGVFLEIQSSINYILSIRAKPKKGWLKFIKNRLLSFSLIAGMGFVLIVSLFVNTLMDLLFTRLQKWLGMENAILLNIGNLVLLFLVIAVLFAIVYKVLPDAYISWSDAFKGATFTGIFFLIGKFLIGFYLGNSNLGNTYGAAASVILILSWVYYSAIILYFGAEFTKVYALSMGHGIHPYETAVFIVKREAKEMPALYEHPDAEKDKQKVIKPGEKDEA